MNIVRRATMVLIAASMVFPSAGLAQDTTRAAPWLAAFSVGFPSVEGELFPGAFTIGGNFTRIRPGKLSPDFSFGTVPRALKFGVLAWGARAGLALPIQSGRNTFIVPSAGLSTIGALGADEGIMGTNTGIAIACRTGVRAGVTWHRFWDNRGSALLVEMGIGRIR